MDGDVAARIRALEEKLMTPEVRASAETLASLLADDFCEFGSSGRKYDKRTIIAELVEETAPLERGVEDFSARRLGPDVVLATYRSYRSIVDGGRRVALRSSIWIFRDERWQLLFHQGTRQPPEG